MSLVFLGAGASEPFGIPTMREMVRGFGEKLEGEHPELHPLYAGIVEALEGEYGGPATDIESMLHVIGGIAAGTGPAQLGRLAFYYARRYGGAGGGADDGWGPSADEAEAAGRLEVELRRYVRAACRQGARAAGDAAAYERSYLPLFTHMGGARRSYGGAEMCRDWKAYTTNYDNVFENFWKAYEPAADHFERIGDSERYAFRTDPLGDGHTFSKLHGSMDWTREVDGGTIVRESRTGYSPVETEGSVTRLSVHGGGIHRHPWFSLFQDLKSGLEGKGTWYVVGYSFNDDTIRGMFEESLAGSPSKHMILIDPDAERIRGRFAEGVRGQIGVLPARFGGESFGLQLRDYVEGTRTLVVRILPNSAHEPGGADAGQPDPGAPLRARIQIRCNKGIGSVRLVNFNGVSCPGMGEDGSLQADGSGQASCTLDMPRAAELQLEVKIRWEHYGAAGDDDEPTELKISDGVMSPKFRISYGKDTIASSNDVKNVHTTIDGRRWCIVRPVNIHAPGSS